MRGVEYFYIKKYDRDLFEFVFYININCTLNRYYNHVSFYSFTIFISIYCMVFMSCVIIAGMSLQANSLCVFFDSKLVVM